MAVFHQLLGGFWGVVVGGLAGFILGFAVGRFGGWLSGLLPHGKQR